MLHSNKFNGFFHKANATLTADKYKNKIIQWALLVRSMVARISNQSIRLYFEN